jgi:hypothetical protein
MNPLVEKETSSPIMTRVKVCAILFALAALLLLQPLNAVAQQARPADTGFSFAVYGDSRSMMYLPLRADQEADDRQIMVEMFELVFPQKTAQAVVQKDVKFIFDPATHELVQVEVYDQSLPSLGGQAI